MRFPTPQRAALANESLRGLGCAPCRLCRISSNSAPGSPLEHRKFKEHKPISGVGKDAVMVIGTATLPLSFDGLDAYLYAAAALWSTARLGLLRCVNWKFSHAA